MSTPSMHRPRHASNHSSVEHPDDSEPRDTGTFKATLPELGGFLTEDGEPVQPEHEEPSRRRRPVQSVAVPFYREDDRRGSGLWITLAATLMLVCAVATTLVAFLLTGLNGDVLGQADGLISMLRTSVF